MTLFGSLDREQLIGRMRSEKYDLLIIGGGITGAGIALDAVTRGLKVGLLEKNDFASGTSSKSTKLIHGGLRYLKQFEIALVREVGMERAVVHNLAPHLVRSEKMLLPLIKDGTYGKILTSFGLMVYDVLAGVEKTDQRKMLDKDETMSLEPLLDESVVEGGGIYAEYRTDDARLTIEILKTAASFGAHLINYAEALNFKYENKRISGVTWGDNLTGEQFEISADYVISAAGPWVDEIRARNKSLEGKKLHPTKGVHIVVAHAECPVEQSIYFDVPDGRMIFAIPRGRVTYIGTTDTDYYGDINDVRTKRADVEYLIRGANHMFPDINLTIDDVESSWAGLRPLVEEEGKSASQISRKDEIFESESGLLSIAGGKLTGYRKMAERILDRLVKRMEEEGKMLKECQTEKVVLTGGVFVDDSDLHAYEEEVRIRVEELGLDSFYTEYLVGNYGRQTEHVFEYFHQRKETDLDERMILSELQFTINYESVQSVLDFFERRTGRLYFYISSIPPVAESVLRYMQEQLKWSSERLDSERDWLDEAIKKASEFHS